MVVVPEEAAIVKRIFQNFLDGKSRLETERELNGEGLTTKNGCKWADSNIKVVLTNITYTGNLLLQKEFIEDPITKKRKKNKGELPQYFVENTHEAIIDMDTFQYVQDEMAKRKEMGPFANKSLHITCFTSKIKCSICGKSYRRSGKKQRKNPDEIYYVWICRTKSEKGSKACDAKTIPEKMLKKVCAEVLNLEEFDEDIFLDQIDHIEPIGPDQLDFYFYDGHVIHQKWKSTARTDCWTAERRKAWAKEKKGKNYREKDHNPYTGMIRCPSCGANFRRQTRKYVNGEVYVYWHCPSSTSCGNSTKVPEFIINEHVVDILNLKKFDESTFRKKIKNIDILEPNIAIYHLADGTDITKEWEPYKHPRPRHTEEYKEKMRQYMKDYWTDERKEEMSKRMQKIRSEKKW
ncbi:MAG: recombinase family protein [Eggerthia catenaformis]|uniref:recombinase family protein n=1 Tax=Eggerthia catenaformis TaxID=31973 RepID=UPI003FA08D4B